MNIKYCSSNWPYGSDGGLFVCNHIVFGRYSGGGCGGGGGGGGDLRGEDLMVV
jgi:hypothetical protein